MNKADASFVNTKKKVQNKGVAMNGMEENMLRHWPRQDFIGTIWNACMLSGKAKFRVMSHCRHING